MKILCFAIFSALAACAPPPQVSLPVTAGMKGTNASIAEFCKLNMGRKVGDGECWALANEAFKATGKKRPGSDMRVWGRRVDPVKEALRAGDIVEFESARFSEGIITGSHHTAVVIEGGSGGDFTVAEQNFAGGKVTFREMNLRTLMWGKVFIYRPA